MLVIKRIAGGRGRDQTESDVERLGRYIRGGGAEDKIVSGFDGQLNLYSSNMDTQLIQVKNLLRENPRPKHPVLHYVMSWGEEDPLPTPVQVQQSVEILMNTVGLGGCYTFWSAHKNTENFHVHVVVCGLDPVTSKQRKMSFDKVQAMRAKAIIEHKLGLGHYEHDLFSTWPDGSVEINQQREEGPFLSVQARDFETRTGAASAQRLAKEQALPILETALSWQEVHTQLAARKMSIVPRRGGLVVTVNGISVKASQVSRECSKKNLEKKWGKYEPSHMQQFEFSNKNFVPLKEMDADLKELWQQYRQRDDASDSDSFAIWLRKNGHTQEAEKWRYRLDTKRQTFLLCDEQERREEEAAFMDSEPFEQEPSIWDDDDERLMTPE